MFFILVDAHSKWMEVNPTNAATTTSTISHLRLIFAAHGLPEMLVTDNAPVTNSNCSPNKMASTMLLLHHTINTIKPQMD